MAIQFPQDPTDGQVYPDYALGDDPLDNGLTYYWSDADGAWQVSCDASDEYVKRAGDDMSGFLFLRDNIGQTQLATDEAHATTKAYVDRRFTELEEEIDGIAPSVQRGTWKYNANEQSANRNPGAGYFYLQKLVTPNMTVVSTYAEANQLVISNTNADGQAQSFGTAEAGYIISMFNVEDDGYFLGEIEVIGTDAGGYRVFTFAPDSAALQPVNNKLARLNIFEQPSGGSASDFLNKTQNDQIGLKDDRDILYKVACSDGSSSRGVQFKLDTDKDLFKVVSSTGTDQFKIENNQITLDASSSTYIRRNSYLSYGDASYECKVYGKLNVGYGQYARLVAKTSEAESNKGSSGTQGPGSAGQVLKSNGSSKTPYWGSAGAAFRHGTSTNPSLSTGEGYFNTDQRVLYIGL